METVRLKADNAVSALIQLGRANDICFGIEMTDIDLLSAPASVDVRFETLETVIRNLLPERRRYDIDVSEGVVLVHAADPKRVPAQLDMIVPEYKISTLTVPEASLALLCRVKRVADPSIQGFVGSFSSRYPGDKVLPIDERGRTVCELLTMIVSRSRGGAWVAGSCPVSEIPQTSRSCWTVLEYRDDPELLANEVSAAVNEESRRLETSDRTPEKL
jgi:hypothetical protein